MNLVAIKSLSARVPAAAQALVFGDALLGITVREHPQVVVNQLVEALPQRLRLLSGQGNNAVVDRKHYLHELSILGEHANVTYLRRRR